MVRLLAPTQVRRCDAPACRPTSSYSSWPRPGPPSPWTCTLTRPPGNCTRTPLPRHPTIIGNQDLDCTGPWTRTSPLRHPTYPTRSPSDRYPVLPAPDHYVRATALHDQPANFGIGDLAPPTSRCLLPRWAIPEPTLPGRLDTPVPPSHTPGQDVLAGPGRDPPDLDPVPVNRSGPLIGQPPHSGPWPTPLHQQLSTRGSLPPPYPDDNRPHTPPRSPVLPRVLAAAHQPDVAELCTNLRDASGWPEGQPDEARTAWPVRSSEQRPDSNEAIDEEKRKLMSNVREHEQQPGRT